MFRVEVTGFDRAAEVLQMLSLPPALRRRFLSRLGRMAIGQAQKNVRDQKTVGGAAFTPRSPKHPKPGPMLKNLVKSKWIRLFLLGDSAAEVGFARNAGYVAGKHQLGSDETFKIEKNDKIFESSPLNQKCNREQALRLIQLGFARPLADIMREVSVWDAINWLKNHKEQWVVRVPARPFLGASPELRKVWADALMGDIQERFRAKNYANLLT